MANNDESKDVMAADIIGRISIFGNNCVVKLIANVVKRPRIKMILVIDNSGSMGRLSKEVTSIIGRGMVSIPNIDYLPASVMVFSNDAQILSDKIVSVVDIDELVAK